MDERNISKLLLPEIEKLIVENKLLSKQLSEAKESIDAIKAGSIDAVVIANKKGLKVYTENAADKIYRILIEKMHEGAVTLDEKGTIIYCNSYFAERVNLPLHKVIGTEFKNFIDASLKKRLDDLVHGKANSLREEIYLRTNDAQAIPMLMSANTFSVDNNFVLSIILTDLSTQLKHQEELKLKTRQLEQKNIELESANKDLTSFTYISSHDLQEPLRKIQNFVSILLEEEKNLSETGKGYFNRMGKTAGRMQVLIEDLLIYSRTKNNIEKFEQIDLNIIIDEVKRDFEEVILEKKALIKVTNSTTIHIIRFQFHQLIHNLISNSLKFSKPGTAPNIKIKSEIVKMNILNNEDPASIIDYCHIIYTDNGIGFDPQYSLRIFDVFQRLHSQDEYKGTGIGLAICKRIIENHSGVITASGKINKGAKFDIFIPVIKQ